MTRPHDDGAETVETEPQPGTPAPQKPMRQGRIPPQGLQWEPSSAYALISGFHPLKLGEKPMGFCARSTRHLGQQLTCHPIVPMCWARTTGQISSPSRAPVDPRAHRDQGSGVSSLPCSGRGQGLSAHQLQARCTWEALWLPGAQGVTVCLGTLRSCLQATDRCPLNNLNILLR